MTISQIKELIQAVTKTKLLLESFKPDLEEYYEQEPGAGTEDQIENVTELISSIDSMLEYFSFEFGEG